MCSAKVLLVECWDLIFLLKLIVICTVCRQKYSSDFSMKSKMLIHCLLLSTGVILSKGRPRFLLMNGALPVLADSYCFFLFFHGWLFFCYTDVENPIFIVARNTVFIGIVRQREGAGKRA